MITPSPTTCQSLDRQMQVLFRANLDAYARLCQAAEEVQDSTTAHFLNELAAERSGMTGELQRFAAWEHDEDACTGPLQCQLHALWLKILHQLNSDDTPTALFDVGQCDRLIWDAYLDALKLAKSASFCHSLLISHLQRLSVADIRCREFCDESKSRRTMRTPICP